MSCVCSSSSDWMTDYTKSKTPARSCDGGYASVLTWWVKTNGAVELRRPLNPSTSNAQNTTWEFYIQILPGFWMSGQCIMFGHLMCIYTNIDRSLPNKLHGPMHYKIGVTCVYNWHMFYTLFVITWQSNPPVSQFNCPCNEFTSVWSMFVYNTSRKVLNVTFFPKQCPIHRPWLVVLWVCESSPPSPIWLYLINWI